MKPFLKQIEKTIIQESAYRGGQDEHCRMKIRSLMKANNISYIELGEKVKVHWLEKGLKYSPSKSYLRSILYRPIISPKLKQALLEIFKDELTDEDFV